VETVTCPPDQPLRPSCTVVFSHPILLITAIWPKAQPRDIPAQKVVQRTSLDLVAELAEIVGGNILGRAMVIVRFTDEAGAV
jgi:hypothetical protein